MSGHIFKRADGSSNAAKGYRPSSPKLGSKKFTASRSVSKLPPRVDLRKYMTPVEDQESLGSCTSNAVAGAYEYLVKRHNKVEDYDVSRLFIYYNARDLEDAVDSDDGCYISSAIQGLQEKGACSETTWPYEIDQFTEQPPEEAYDEASNFIVEDTQFVEVNLTAWKEALAEGHPIIFGLSLFSSFDSQKQPGLVPQPTKKEVSRDEHSGHAMLCVGYSDRDKIFIVRNSWGEDWGDEGYCYIPYDYLMNSKYNMGDSWIIKQLTNFELDESTWGDDSSITEDYDTELADMGEEDYENMLDAMGDYPLEFRIGYILCIAAGADGDISEEEYDEMATYMQSTLEKLGVKMSAKKILKNCFKEIEEGDDDFLSESIDLLGEHLSSSLLAKLLNDIREIVGVDDLSDEEEEFVNNLTTVWQVEENSDSTLSGIVTGVINTVVEALENGSEDDDEEEEEDDSDDEDEDDSEDEDDDE